MNVHKVMIISNEDETPVTSSPLIRETDKVLTLLQHYTGHNASDTAESDVLMTRTDKLDGYVAKIAKESDQFLCSLII